MYYKLGIDIGSTTLKTVVLDKHNQIVYKSYERHLSRVMELAQKKIRELKDCLAGQDIKVAVTGSAGLGVANATGLDFVQEVFATAGGVKRMYPDTDVVIELGGEDAKIIFLQGTLEERMNSTCAGGTGAFIDQMAALLGVSLEELDALSLNATDLYAIASRCGVFAKTDIQPLINQGAKKENIAASIFQAVVDQTIGGLAQGRPIQGTVLFLGGPLAFLKGLQARFTATLDMERAIFPELSQYFVALGSAFYAEGLEQSYTYEQLLERLCNIAFVQEDVNVLEPLFADDGSYGAFCERHSRMAVGASDPLKYTGKAYLGIDAGSTTTKLVLTDAQDNLLYSHYCQNLGSPLAVVQEQLGHIYELCGDRIQIVSAAVTGYGEDLIKNAFGIDNGVVETMAHYTAAKHFNPQVDFIIDIGGQDIKCFEIKDGTIDSVMLNEACSSGCGSFIATFANSLGYPIEEFAQLGLFAKRPVDLGTRCTVFMNSSVKQAQKNGATVEDISAGLAMSVVKNAIYKVIRAKSAEELGKNIVVQGGTFYNDAVLRCFELLIGREVIRPEIAGLMGAYGAALFAKAHTPEQTGLISPEELAAFTHTSQVVNCGLCTNKCNLTVNTFANGRKFISGNRCERPTKGKTAVEYPNLYKYKQEQIEKLESKPGKRGRVGIPLALNVLETIHFWHPFFTELGFEVVLSDVSTRRLYARGQHTIPSDTVCYPAKLAHGHILNLQDKGVDAIFYPCMSYNVDEKMSDNHFNCPVVAYYPEVIAGNVALDTKLVYPYVSLNDKKLFVKKMMQHLAELAPDISKQEVRAAAEAGYCSLEQYRAGLFQAGERALAFAQEHGLKTIVLAGRPYHVDPEINHGIDQLISTLGFVILSEDAIPDQKASDKLHVLNQWTYHARMYNAAEFVTKHDNMELVQLVSFGCGIDAVTTDELRDILRGRGKLYTQIKIDEINNLGAVKIRLRSLLAAMEERAANG